MQLVAEFQSLVDGRRFDVTGTTDPEGNFALDEEIESIKGPFFVFAVDGLPARFLGLRDRPVIT